MNKRQRIVQEQFLNNEEEVIRRLKSIYSASQKDIEKKAQALQDDINRLDTMARLAVDADEKEKLLSMKQSKVYQKQYQDALKKQIDSILDNMQVEEFKAVSEYLQKCYEDGFVGTMFDLQGQGIPLCFPMDQESVVRAVQLDSKISHGLYTRLGEDIAVLKKKISAQVSRGIATGMTFQQVAQQLAATSNTGYFNAIRIARTEGHRIQVQAGMDACYKAKDMGADVVKQWDSTLDDRTRESHVAVDGEIRELDKPFSNGLMFPGDPDGAAAEVINCRCALLQRARWALDEDELETLKERAEYFGLDKAEQFDDFKKKYLKAVEELTNNSNRDTMSSGAITGAYNNKNDPEGIMRKAHAEKYYSSMRNSNKAPIVSAIAKNAGVDAKSVSKMYDHLFINKYNLDKGLANFDEDYDIAESLRRLREGKDIQEHDLLLIAHEALEFDLMNKDGLPYEEAHAIANKSFDYQSALERWLDKIEG